MDDEGDQDGEAEASAEHHPLSPSCTGDRGAATAATLLRERRIPRTSG